MKGQPPLNIEYIVGAIILIILLITVLPTLTQINKCCQDYEKLKGEYNRLNTLYESCLEEKTGLEKNITVLDKELRECDINLTYWYNTSITLQAQYDILKAKVDNWNFYVTVNWVFIYAVNFLVIFLFKVAFNFKIIIETEEGEKIDLIMIAIISGIITAIVSLWLGIIPVG